MGSNTLRFNAGGAKEELALSPSRRIGDKIKFSLASWMERFWMLVMSKALLGETCWEWDWDGDVAFRSILAVWRVEKVLRGVGLWKDESRSAEFVTEKEMNVVGLSSTRSIKKCYEVTFCKGMPWIWSGKKWERVGPVSINREWIQDIDRRWVKHELLAVENVTIAIQDGPSKLKEELFASADNGHGEHYNF